jgi:hypothetical protein
MTNNDPVEKLLDLSRRALAKSALKPVLLPAWSETKRGTPNTFLRSALFSAIQSKDRVDMKGVVLASQSGVIVTYTGEQLNQDDLTVWETLVHLAKEEPLGTICEFSTYEILKTLNLGLGGDERNRLHRIIIRLNACSVQIQHAGKTFFGSLIESGFRDDKTQRYIIKLSQELIKLYGKTEWTGVNWQQRDLLKRKPLAMSLHGYYSSHQKPFPIKLETLQKFSGGRNKQPAGFKIKVNKALDELVKVGFLTDFSITGDLVSVTKNSSVVRDTK